MRQTLIITSFLLLAITRSFGQDANFDEGLKSFDSKDYKNAFEKLMPYANSGSCLAQFVIGYCYQYGRSVEKNDSLAIHWLEMSAEQKQPNAMGPLAACLFAQGRENIKAYLWAVLAAEYLETQKYMTTRYVIKEYLTDSELDVANTQIEQYKLKWKNQEICR